MPFNIKPWEFLIIVALILLLFGAKRLPDAARGLGRSLRIFKAETKALHDDDGPDAPTASSPAPEATAAPQAIAPAVAEPTAEPVTQQQRTET
jgi:sec-independent protein translocase protein TatA